MINGGIRFGEVETAQPFVCRNKKDENQSEEGEEGRKGGWKVDRGSERAVDREKERRETRAVASAGRGKLTESLI